MRWVADCCWSLQQFCSYQRSNNFFQSESKHYFILSLMNARPCRLILARWYTVIIWTHFIPKTAAKRALVCDGLILLRPETAIYFFFYMLLMIRSWPSCCWELSTINILRVSHLYSTLDPTISLLLCKQSTSKNKIKKRQQLAVASSLFNFISREFSFTWFWPFLPLGIQHHHQLFQGQSPLQHPWPQFVWPVWVRKKKATKKLVENAYIIGCTKTQ